MFHLAKRVQTYTTELWNTHKVVDNEYLIFDQLLVTDLNCFIIICIPNSRKKKTAQYKFGIRFRVQFSRVIIQTWNNSLARSAEDLSWSHFLAFREHYLQSSVHNICHCFTYPWLTKFLIVFSPIIIQNYDVLFARCYTFCTGVTLISFPDLLGTKVHKRSGNEINVTFELQCIRKTKKFWTRADVEERYDH